MNVREQRQWLERHPGIPLDECADRVVYAVESWPDALAEMERIFPEHWAALDDDLDEPYAPDYSRYEMLHDAGVLHVVTARRGGELIGYIVFTVDDTSLHHRGRRTVMTDMLYMTQAARAGLVGYKMLRFFMDTIKAMGVRKVYIGTKTKEDIGVLYSRLGFREVERIYTQVL